MIPYKIKYYYADCNWSWKNCDELGQLINWVIALCLNKDVEYISVWQHNPLELRYNLVWEIEI